MKVIMVFWGGREVKGESFEHFGIELWGNLGKIVGFGSSS